MPWERSDHHAPPMPCWFSDVKEPCDELVHDVEQNDIKPGNSSNYQDGSAFPGQYSASSSGAHETAMHGVMDWAYSPDSE
eukprot:572755-Karenia_brevis.AAC.1